MLKEVSISKKKIKDKNSLVSNDSVIVEHGIQDKNRRVLSRNDIDLSPKIFVCSEVFVFISPSLNMS